MKSRRPAVDPQPEDILAYKGWTITVIARWPGEVEYNAVHRSHSKPKNGRQPISVWREWASKAKVKSAALSAEECVETANVSARCEVEKHAIQGMTHCIGLKLYCKDHCVAQHKPKKGLLHARSGS